MFSSGLNLVGKLDPIPESPHVDHHYAINHSSRPLIQELLAEVEQLRDEKRQNKATIHNLLYENGKLKRKLGYFQTKYESCVQGNLPLKTQNEIICNKLSGKFTPAQLGIILSDKKRTRSNLWSKKDYTFAMKIRQCGTGSRVLKFLRESQICPVPSNTTLTKKFSFIHTMPGIIHPVIKFFKSVQADLTDKDILVQITYDETYTKQKVGWDRQLDQIFGPAKNVQLMVLRSIASTKLKYPVFFGFDCPLPKKLYLEIIHALESCGMKVLMSVCDQGGKNVSLQNSLKVTEERNYYPNPYDKSRNILWSFDFWHCIKNLRY